MASRAQVPLFDGDGQPWRASRKRAPKGVTAPQVKASTYEAAGTGRRMLGWRAPTTSPNVGTLEHLTTLRDRSRQATRNDGYAKGVIDKLVYNIVGTGIKPLSLSTDQEWRKQVHALWARWVRVSDADGRLSWYGQQQQIVRCWLEAGEVFLRLRSRRPEDGLPVPLQVQVIEPELCPHLHNGRAANGNNIRAGIEFDAIGRRVAYYFYATRPGDLVDWNQGDLRRVTADQVLHVYKPMRAGQLRGLPHLTQALIRLRELDKFDDATVLRQQLANMFVAFLEHPASDSSSVLPIMGETSADTVGDRGVLALQPGIFQELQAGEKVTFSDPPDLTSGYKDFIRQQLMSACAATGVPYEVLTGDMSGLNDRVMRVVLHEFRRYIMSEQYETVGFQVCDPVWSAWLTASYLSGALPMPGYETDPTPYQMTKWMPQGWPYIHPVQDVEAAKQAIRSGLTSRSDIVSEQGEDSEIIDAMQAADNERADELGLVYDSDPRYASNAGLTQARPPGSVIPATTDEGGDPGNVAPDLGGSE